jgi:hypothetical protein
MTSGRSRRNRIQILPHLAGLGKSRCSTGSSSSCQEVSDAVTTLKKRSGGAVIDTSTAAQPQEPEAKKIKTKTKQKSVYCKQQLASSSRPSSFDLLRANVYFKLRGLEYGRRRVECKMQMHNVGEDSSNLWLKMTQTKKLHPEKSTLIHQQRSEATNNNPNSLGLCRAIELRHLVEASPTLKKSVLLGFHVHGSHLLAYSVGSTQPPLLTSVICPRPLVGRMLVCNSRRLGRHICLEVWRTDFAGRRPQAHLWHSIAVPIVNSPHLRDVGHPILSVTQSACGSLLAVATPVQARPESLDVRLTLAPLPAHDPFLQAARHCLVRALDLRFTVYTTDNSTIPNEYYMQEMMMRRKTTENVSTTTSRDNCLILCLNLGDALSFLDLEVQTHAAVSDSCASDDESTSMAEPLWGWKTNEVLSDSDATIKPWLLLGNRDEVEEMVSSVRLVDIGGTVKRKAWTAAATAANQPTNMQDDEQESHDDDDDDDDDEVNGASGVSRRGARSRPATRSMWAPSPPAGRRAQQQQADEHDVDDSTSVVCASVAVVDNFKLLIEPLLVAALATKGIHLTPSQSGSSCAIASRNGPKVSSSSRVLLSYCAQLIQMDPLRNVAEVSCAFASMYWHWQTTSYFSLAFDSSSFF